MASATRDLSIELLPIASIKGATRNPKDHSIPALQASLRSHGFVAPLVLDERSGRLVAGHGRLEALRGLLAAGEAPPAGVLTEGDEWLVPVVRGVRFANPKAAEAYLLADNRLTEIGGWNDTELLEVLRDMQAADLLEQTAFGEEDIVALLRSIEDHTPIDRDALPEPTPRASVGDIWTVGRHRVACGDSQDADLVARLLDGAEPALMVTDPPYGVNYDPAWRARAGVNTRSINDEGIANDDRADWATAYALFPGQVAYVWHSGLHAATVLEGLLSQGFELRAQLVWVKEHLALSRGHFHWRHEPCWYVVRKGKANWIGGRKQDTVFDAQGGGGGQGRRPELWHPNQKPVELLVQLISNHRGDVYDPFIGSGSTAVAAEEVGRASFGIDLEPKWVDMAVQRLADVTGLEPVRS